MTVFFPAMEKILKCSLILIYQMHMKEYDKIANMAYDLQVYLMNISVPHLLNLRRQQTYVL